jgi:hypothetical protein
MSSTTNPPIGRLLRLVTAFEVSVLLVAGGGLFFLPNLISPLWPWPLTPFNTRFLGAIYLASMVAAALLVYSGRWSPARLVTPMIFLFTLIVLFVSLLYLEQFNRASPSTWLWLLLYVGIPLNAGYHLWLYRRWPPPATLTLAAGWRTYLLAQTTLFGLYGLALLLAPVTATAFWPWPLDALHGRMYSVAFFSAAQAAFLLYRAASPSELLTVGLSQLTLGLLAIAGLLMVDASVHRVNWSAAGTWLWLAGFALLAATALALLLFYVTTPNRFVVTASAV